MTRNITDIIKEMHWFLTLTRLWHQKKIINIKLNHFWQRNLRFIKSFPCVGERGITTTTDGIKLVCRRFITCYYYWPDCFNFSQTVLICAGDTLVQARTVSRSCAPVPQFAALHISSWCRRVSTPMSHTPSETRSEPNSLR